MHLQIVSDLHLELLGKTQLDSILKPSCEILAVLGDTCELQHQQLWKSFVEYVSSNWKTVLIVNGNHEYHNDHEQTIDELKLQQKEGLPSNVFLLDNQWIKLEKCIVWGGTFWTFIPTKFKAEVESTVRDYQYTFVNRQVSIPGTQETTIIPVKLKTEHVNEMHREAVLSAYNCLLQHPDDPVVILTHHAPLTRGTSDPRYQGDRNCAYGSDQSGMFSKPNLKLWAFGHTHWNVDFMYKDTRVISNPYGYESDTCSKTFDGVRIFNVLL